MTTTENLDMIHVFYGIRQMYMQVWETAEKWFSMGVPALELFDWCKHEYAEKDAFLESVIEDFKQVYSAQPEIIKCGECKYWQEEMNGKGTCKDEYGFSRWWKADDFCSNAERKEGEEDE